MRMPSLESEIFICFANVLCPVVKVAGVKLAGAEQHRVEGILDDGFLLVCIKSGSNDILRMIIYCGRTNKFLHLLRFSRWEE